MDAHKRELIVKLFAKLKKANVLTEKVLTYHTSNPDEWSHTKRFLFTGGSNLIEITKNKEDRGDKEERKAFKFSGSTHLLDTDRAWANIYTQIEEPYTRRTLTTDVEA